MISEERMVPTKNTNQGTAPNSGIQMSWYCKKFATFYTNLAGNGLFTFGRNRPTYHVRHTLVGCLTRKGKLFIRDH